MSSTERLVPPGPAGHGQSTTPQSPTALRGRRYDEDRLHLLVRDPRRVLAVWELRAATASAASAKAEAAGSPVRYRLRVEFERENGLPPEVVAETDLPDALGGEGWYLAIPPRAGRCRAWIGLEVRDRFETLLVSRWVATPPDGPCDRIASWPLRADGESWVAREWREPRSVGTVRPAPSSSARYLPPPMTGDARPTPEEPARKERA